MSPGHQGPPIFDKDVQNGMIIDALKGWNSSNHKSIPEEIKSRMKSGNVCYHSVQNLLFSTLLSKNVNIKTYGIIILPVLYRRETWSLTFREQCRPIMFSAERDEVTGEWRKYIQLKLYSLQTIIRLIKSRRIGWAGHSSCIGERCIKGFAGES
jgi:hypothetical protein